MRKLTVAVAALLAGYGLVFGQAQGFENYNYTTTTPAASTASSSSSTDMKFSTYLAVGAGFSRGGDFVGKSRDIRTVGGADSYTNSDDEYLNLGHGLKIDVGASYRFLEHVDGLLGFNISLGVPRCDVETTTTFQAPALPTVVDEDVFHNAQFGFKLLVQPRFTVFSLIDVYVGGGIGLYWTSFSEDVKSTTGATTVTTTTDYGTKATVPFIGVLGAEYPLSKRFILFLDLTYEAMNVTVDKMKVGSVTTKYKRDSNDNNFENRIPASNVALRVGLRVPLF
jgi:hypothetical protein